MTPKKDSDSAATNQKYFSRDQTFDHYFGTRFSRLILEVEHTHIDGSVMRHCQIIEKGENFKLKRFLYPGGYAQIKDLFWDFPEDDSGAGTRSDTPIHKTLLTELKARQAQSMEVKTDEALREHIFTANALSPQSSQFCLFPLAEHVADKHKFAEKCDNLFALIKLLYNQNADSLKTVLASKVEKTESSQMRLNFDVRSLVEQHSEFAEQQSILDKLTAMQSRFLTLQSLYAKVMQEEALAKDIVLQLSVLYQQRDRATTEVQNALKKAEPLQRQEALLNESLTQKVKEMSEHRGELNLLNKQYSDCKKVYTKMRDEIDAYPADTPNQEILNNLLDHLNDKSEQKKALEDADFCQQKIKALDANIDNLKDNIAKLKVRIANSQHKLGSQLPSVTSDVLNAVNPELLLASPGRTLTSDEQNALTNFTELFTKHGQEYALFDAQFSQPTSHNSLEDKLSALEDALIDEQNERTKYTLPDNPLLRATNRQDLEKDISTTEELIQLFQDYPNIVKQHANLLTEFDTQEQVCEEFKEKLEIYRAQHVEANEQLQQQLNAVEALKQNLRILESQVERLDKRHEHAILANAELHNDPYGVELDTDNLAQKYLELSAIKVHYAQMGDIIVDEYITTGLIEDSSDIRAGRTEAKILATYQTIAERYASLEALIEHLQDDVREHNRQIKAGMERLAKANDKIDEATAQINSELAIGEFNDLDGVRLQVTKNEQFVSLINAWHNFDSLSDSLMETRWYQQLTHVMQSNLVEQGAIVLKNTIVAVGYETKEFSDAPWTDKSQSNSTTMLINVMLGNIFIHNLLASSTHMSFPLPLDEVASISHEAVEKNILSINQKGHTIVGITTHGSSGAFTQLFTNHLIMDAKKTAHPYTKNRRAVVFVPDLTEAIFPQEQAELFDA